MGNSNKKTISFSNSTDAEAWQIRNCHQCSKYESESEREEEAKCIAAFYIDLGYISGEIPIEKVKNIVGIKEDKLNNNCNSISEA